VVNRKVIVYFADIGGIVDHPWLYFFHNTTVSFLLIQKKLFVILQSPAL